MENVERLGFRALIMENVSRSLRIRGDHYRSTKHCKLWFLALFIFEEALDSSLSSLSRTLKSKTGIRNWKGVVS